jgi:TRAP-type C4-dicarboxylate transport system permease small subunit
VSPSLFRIEAVAISCLRGLLGLGLILMVVLNVANAVGRYGGLPTLTGADELLVFGMIWIVMVGAILATRDRTHLSIDLVPQRLSQGPRALLLAATGAVTAVVCAFIAFHSLTFVERIAAIGQTSMGLGIPMVIPHLAVFAGFAGIAVVAAILALFDFRAFLTGSGG